MARNGTRNDWGFPRWRGYGSSSAAQKVRICDRHGCNEEGKCPAPKSPNNPDRWMFCEPHAAEYNRQWNYFEGLSKEEAAEPEARERADFSGYREAAHYGWVGSGDGSRSPDEMRALEALGLESDADFSAIKKAWRERAKEVHPDVKPGDKDAAAQFLKLQTAYEVLRHAEERREWQG